MNPRLQRHFNLQVQIQPHTRCSRTPLLLLLLRGCLLRWSTDLLLLLVLLGLLLAALELLASLGGFVEVGVGFGFGLGVREGFDWAAFFFGHVYLRLWVSYGLWSRVLVSGFGFCALVGVLGGEWDRLRGNGG